MTCVRSLFFGLLSALILGGMSFDAIAAAPNGDKANVESVELFQGIKDGKIDAKIVFKNRKSAVVSVENKTKQPLNVIMPEVAGAVPVLAQMGKEAFLQFHNQQNQDACMDMGEKRPPRMTDEKAFKTMRKICACENAAEFQTLPTEKRNDALSQLLKKGVSIRQASRITGVSVGVVRIFTEKK